MLTKIGNMLYKIYTLCFGILIRSVEIHSGYAAAQETPSVRRADGPAGRCATAKRTAAGPSESRSAGRPTSGSICTQRAADQFTKCSMLSKI